jgi:hypothetical protein
MKTNNIYVVDNEKDIILRHIIIANNNKNILEIEKYYMKELPAEYSFSQKNIAKINNKRLIKEIEHIEKYKKIENKFIKDIILDSNVDIYLKLIFKLITCTGDNINLVFILRDYPMSPSIIYLENISISNIKFLNNKIYIDKMVIPSYHNIKTKLVDILDNIICIISENTYNITNTSNIETILGEYDNYINTNKLFIT